MKTAVLVIAEKVLTANGANYTTSPVEVDGGIVTGNGPDATQQFDEILVKMLMSNAN